MYCKDLPNECGIYLITNNLSGHRYVGSSKLVRKRVNKHRADLRANRHHNLHLQNSFNLHGEENFDARCIVLCGAESLLEMEEYYISELDPEYNVIRTPAASGKSFEKYGFSSDRLESHRAAFQSPTVREKLRLGSLMAHLNNPNQALEHSEFMKKLNSDPEFKRHHAEITKLAMRSKSVRGKFCALTDDEVIEILRLKSQGISNRNISILLGKKLHTVDDVSSGRTYKHIDRVTFQVDEDFYL